MSDTARILGGPSASPSLGGGMELNSFTEISQTNSRSHSTKEEEEEQIDDQQRSGREEETGVLGGYKLVLVTIGLCFCIFCTSLDNTIVATAVPKITQQFHSLDDVGWYASAYLLTTCAVTLTFGRLYTFFPIKWVYLSALFVFELGSFICGITPSSLGLILGRAVAGLGGGGLFSGSLLIITQCVPLRRRPAFSGFIMSVFAVASVIAPLMGGAFTDHASWRWCFYINLPFGLISAVVILFTFQNTQPVIQASLREKVVGLDPLGTATFLPAIVCLLLATQWGGAQYPWGDGRIVALFVLFGVLLVCFIGLQLWARERATVPPRLLRGRNIWGSALYGFCLNGAMFTFVYYLPIWFQAVQGASATESGIRNLPLIISNVVFAIVSGVLVTVTGYFGPFMLLGAAMASISAGLLSTLQPGSGTGEWIGYQVVLGMGIGVGFQLPVFVVQTTLAAADIPTATALMTFIQLLGGAIFVSVAQNIFRNQLASDIRTALPLLDPTAVINAGPTSLRGMYSGDTLTTLIGLYNDAVVHTFYLAIGLAAASFLAATVIQWRPSSKSIHNPSS
ncbi:hypothetical protein AbraIFM66951_010438 [Aspergillus brasiliensis]|uniref:Major facilitator superfamily (MFS) profile domain-containing protein n=1 Tax=Aspergillus brasiliensis TaxID=319629 RepID=A0A9W5YXB6_9EURO|nr:hypothetical protein AbraCBS73388_010505 [Aspergillus brasiliensis]GKZ47096.1 hypothetical protein AbraIFM66951_010438 [Aspergillus brasiliensis]